MRTNRRNTATILAAVLIILTGTVPYAIAQWPDDAALNLAIADRTSEQVLPKIAAAPDGGCYIGWFDLATGGYQVHLQRLNAEGVEQWPHNGILVSDHPLMSWLVDWDMTVDSAGNAVLVFADIRDGGDLDVFAYQIDSAGGFLWGPDGVQLSANADFEPAPVVCEASDGDLVFVWSLLPDSGDGALLMQRLAPDGTPRFGGGAVPVVSVSGEDPGFPQIVPSAAGDVIVTWVRDISSFLSSRHVHAQRFDETGAAVWGATVAVYDAAVVPIAYTPQLTADGMGGAVIWWHSSPVNLFNSHVQRLDADGSELFPHNGVVVSTTEGLHHIDPALAFLPGSGDCIVFWNERTGNQGQRGIFAQKITSGGARAWGDGGLELMPVDDLVESFPRCVPLGDGAAVFFTNGGFGQESLWGMAVDGDGGQAWETSPLPVATAASNKSRFPLTVNEAGMVVLVWEDDRGDDVDLYAQNVNADGSLGPVASGVDDAVFPGRAQLLAGYPNPFNPRVNVAFALDKTEQARLGVYDVAGRRVAELAAGVFEAGRHDVVWNGRDESGQAVAAGLYFLRLETASRNVVGKVMLVR